MEKYARKCSATNTGINEGYVVNDGEYYFANESALLNYLKGQDFIDSEGLIVSEDRLLEWAYNNEVYYYTEWEDESEYEYQFINGVLTEIE
jgi:hypothetical protein